MLGNFLLYILCLMPLCSIGQSYITGKITDDQQKPLVRVKMKLNSTGFIFRNGNDGEFGISSPKKKDSITCYLEGYDTVNVAVSSFIYNIIVMTPTRITKKERVVGLSSLTNSLIRDPNYIRYVFDETYSSIVENDFVSAVQYPVTGFSLNVNKASYSNVRRFINSNIIMPTDAVRIEELLNYFSFNCTLPPTGNSLFNISSWSSNCPWNDHNILLFINIQAKKTDLDKVPPSNLVFLIDDSGSMDLPNRLPLLKAAFRMLVNNLRDIDTVSLVTYGGSASVMLQPTSGAEKQKIIESIEGLTPGGATPGASGLKLAYEIAKKAYIKNGNNRVILATDGDFNVGQTSEKELEELIVHYRNSGIFLTCLGVGMGNYKDSKLEILAKVGRGNFSYLDNENEAEKVLVKEFTQTLVPIAEEALLRINFSADWIEQYRLIGFDNRQNAITSPNSILEGGEIGSGYSLMAMFEIIPNKKWKKEWSTDSTVKIGELNFQYKLPGQDRLSFINKQLSLNYSTFSDINKQLQFATAVAMFGQLLKQSRFAAGYHFNFVQRIALNAASPTDLLQQEFIKLVEKAGKIYKKKKKY